MLEHWQAVKVLSLTWKFSVAAPTGKLCLAGLLLIIFSCWGHMRPEEPGSEQAPASLDCNGKKEWRGPLVPCLPRRNQLSFHLALWIWGKCLVYILSLASSCHLVIPPGDGRLFFTTSLWEGERQEWPIPVVLPLTDVYGMTLSFHTCVAFLPAHTVHLLDRLHLAVYVGFTAYAKSKAGSE